jgi:hypothetical protein
MFMFEHIGVSRFDESLVSLWLSAESSPPSEIPLFLTEDSNDKEVQQEMLTLQLQCRVFGGHQRFLVTPKTSGN